MQLVVLQKHRSAKRKIFPLLHILAFFTLHVADAQKEVDVDEIITENVSHIRNCRLKA